MSRRRLARVLPNLAVVGQGAAQLPLAQVDEQQRVRHPRRVAVVGYGLASLIPLLNALGAVPVVHVGEESDSAAAPCQPVIASEETVESAGLR